MKKNILMFSTIALFAIVLTGCTTPPQNQVSSEGNNFVEEGADSADTGDSTYIDINECLIGCEILDNSGMVTREMCEGSCWAAEATYRKDFTICDEKIANDNDIPKMACYLGLAEETGNPSYCDPIGDSKEDMMVASCYSTVAQNKKDPTICEEIKESFLYESCIEGTQ